MDRDIGIVIIGRNEGERLRRCMQSVDARSIPVVYVDSGSADGSVQVALASGVMVVRLDASVPLTAARARNEGFDALLQRWPTLSLVQFLDGDCELLPGWLRHGSAALAARRDAVAVCGRVLERAPEATIYNRVCALEWQKDPGEVPACGGNFMIRVDAFRAVGGFRADVVAAEDDELCLRLRRRGGTILHVAADMVSHDVAMSRFGQWWARSRRAGVAYAQGAGLHGRGSERHFVRDCRRLWLWGIVLPGASLLLAWPTGGLSLALLAAYPLQWIRIYCAGQRRGWKSADAAAYALFTVLGKFPGALGMIGYHWRRWRGGAITIIEHKHVGTSS